MPVNTKSNSSYQAAITSNIQQTTQNTQIPPTISPPTTVNIQNTQTSSSTVSQNTQTNILSVQTNISTVRQSVQTQSSSTITSIKTTPNSLTTNTLPLITQTVFTNITSFSGIVLTHGLPATFLKN